MNRPDFLEGLIEAAQKINNRHYERRGEREGGGGRQPTGVGKKESIEAFGHQPMGPILTSVNAAPKTVATTMS